MLADATKLIQAADLSGQGRVTPAPNAGRASVTERSSRLCLGEGFGTFAL
jgi:hypothetical protein